VRESETREKKIMQKEEGKKKKRPLDLFSLISPGVNLLDEPKDSPFPSLLLLLPSVERRGTSLVNEPGCRDFAPF
jgi:hypothetical protein